MAHHFSLKDIMLEVKASTQTKAAAAFETPPRMIFDCQTPTGLLSVRMRPVKLFHKMEVEYVADFFIQEDWPEGLYAWRATVGDATLMSGVITGPIAAGNMYRVVVTAK